MTRTMIRFLAALAVATATLSPAADAATPVLLKDINAGVRMPEDQPVKLADWWYFQSCQEDSGCELWRVHDTGTTAFLVADLVPGQGSSKPAAFVVMGSKLYFAAQNATGVAELWQSNGTAAGTTMIKSFPGLATSFIGSVAVVGSTIYFHATVPEGGGSLWKSDGTGAGTVRLATPDGIAPSGFKALGSLVLFHAIDPMGNLALWRSDGTDAGTFMLAAGSPGIGAVAGPYAWFTRYNGTSVVLWRTDGTLAGTVDLGVISGRDFLAIDSTVYFLGRAGSGPAGIWKSDGTVPGTVSIAPLPGHNGEFIHDESFAAAGNIVIFSALDGTSHRRWWRTDGTPAGTFVLGELQASDEPFAFSRALSLGATVVFNGHDAQAGTELWTTDGSLAGTRRLKDILPGPNSSNFQYTFYGAGSKAYFVASDNGAHPTLWMTDGTEAGTVPVFPGEGPLSFFPIGQRLLYSFGLSVPRTAWITDGTTATAQPLLAAAGQSNAGSACGFESKAMANLVFFPAFDPLHGCELWRTDGTPAGTFLVKDVHPGPGSPVDLGKFTVAGSWLYFVADYAVWKTDGTPDGTSIVANSSCACSVTPFQLVVAGPNLYFTVADLIDIRVLMKTPIGSSAAERIYAAGPSRFVYPDNLASAGSTLFFGDGSPVQSLWKTDGTPQGTVLVKEGSPPLGIRMSVGVGSLLFFADSSFGTLWKSDGTAAGTVPAINSNGDTIIFTSDLVSTNGLAFAAAGGGLWRSDGTAAGTYRVLSPETASPYYLTAAGPYVYFGAGTDATGLELWRSDGTAAGTILVRDIDPSANSGYTGVASAVGQGLYFLGMDATAGFVQSMWFTNGTPATTRKLFDLAPGQRFISASYNPRGSTAGLFIFNVQPGAGFEASFLAREASLDFDGDSLPDAVETPEGRDPFVKDNDVFASARLFVMQQYRDFLGREGDAGGVNFWTAQVNGGVARANMIENFFASREFQGVGSPVARLYFAFFLRVPDYDGLAFQMAALRGGTPLAAIANNFSLSPEFTGRYGALNNPQYVALLYQSVLGRTAAQAEIDYHVNRLAAGATRGDVAVGFSESPEFIARVTNDVYVTMIYAGMLRRAPDAGGFDFWVNYMDAGNSGLALINGFLGGAEYRGRFLP